MELRELKAKRILNGLTQEQLAKKNRHKYQKLQYEGKR